MALLSATGIATALLATTIAPAHAGKGHAPGPRPTVVLVHGAFADSTSWNGVVKKLKRDGYRVVAAANPLRGLAGDATYIKEVLDGIEGPVVLAGHSYAGAVITNAAREADNVKALVYVAAFIPDKGESAAALTDKFPGSTLGSAVKSVPITLPDGTPGADLTIDPVKFHNQFAADVPRNTTDLMAVTQRPIASAGLEQTSGAPAWKTIPSWALVATEDRNIPERTQIFMAERAKAHTVKVRASHAVSVSHPDKVAQLIEQAARTSR
ncbi:alpha/beta fold hydrolase [Streptomyces zhihengii]|uniref:alpha/beta fold hydrolase n=1 Tax=Streptomyces zhihengii TaxID=1818004 RepID=UPI0033AC79A8